MTIFQATRKEDVTVQILEKINTPHIKIVGAHINVNDCMIIFEDRKKVFLENCSFIGGNKNPLIFKNCNEIILKNCTILMILMIGKHLEEYFTQITPLI